MSADRCSRTWAAGSTSEPPAAPDHVLDGGAADTTGLGRFGTRALLGWAAVAFGLIPFVLLWLLVQRSWPPLAGLDGDIAADLNDAVSGSPALVSLLAALTDLGGTATAVLLLTLTTVFLVIRRRRRLAAFVATTGLGLALLVPVTKAVVDRARPVVESPVVQTPSNASFPSGHAMTALVTWGVLLLVCLPGVRRRARPWMVAATVVLVAVIGATRLALGVHFVSDVLAGWALGAGWLGATTASFRAWQHDRGPSSGEPLDPLDVAPDEAAQLAPDPAPALLGGRRAATLLVVVALAVAGLVVGLGLLVTGALTDTWLGRVDRDVVAWFAGLRSSGLTTVMEAVGSLGGTRTVVAVGLSLAVLSLAVAAHWRPVVFVVTTLAGEVVLYWGVAQMVDRVRPAVADLTSGLPTAASWPSGHAAAATAVYGGTAALVLAYGRRRGRWTVLVLPGLLAPAVGISRLYVAAHHPTDVLAGLLLGGLWVVACARVLLPPTGRGSRAGAGAWRTEAAR
ncbi:phosphatase PAP2 family protein [Geodermatophilus sp. SYSU D00710]